MKPDYLQTGYVFVRFCPHCGDRIKFTVDKQPKDNFCSDRCRAESRQDALDHHRRNFARAMGANE